MKTTNDSLIPSQIGFSSTELAIIIPAYKRRFLARAVESVLAQSDQRFRLYVFDDCSPEELSAICLPLLDSGRHHFHRFPENLGGISLADHWSRCVRLTSESWVWVFSDDDIMEPNCVAGFYETRRTSPPDTTVFRFNTVTIDGEDNVIRVNQPHPQFESPIQFAYHRLRGERLSFAPEYLFSRKAFDKVDGFVPFPAAWGSDDASWMTFSGSHTIVTIPTERIRWRMSSENISGLRSTGSLKVEAALQYLEWLAKWSADSARHVPGIDASELEKYAWLWFRGNLASLQRSIRIAELISVSSRLSKILHKKRSECVWLLLRFNLKRLLILRS